MYVDDPVAAAVGPWPCDGCGRVVADVYSVEDSPDELCESCFTQYLKEQYGGTRQALP